MLSRFISKTSNLRLLTQISSKTHLSIHSINPQIQKPTFNFFPKTPKLFSTNHNNNNNNQSKPPPTPALDLWNLSTETNEETIDSVFGDDTGPIQGINNDEEDNANIDLSSKTETDSWLSESSVDNVENDDIFKGIDGKREIGEGGTRGVGGGDEWATAEGYKPWSFVVEEREEEKDVFDIGIEREGEEMNGLAGGRERVEEERERSEEEKLLEKEEIVLTSVLTGPNRTFGDLIAASGITDSMLDSLIALKDLEDIQGLPPLREIEDERYLKNTRKSTRAEIERQKQEEVAKARVRQVDEKGRAYGTGKRKCSIARVWIQPGDGTFVVNDKQFDVYFPILDHRAALLRPFSETKTLGLWDINCTVKGGGVSGQVGAIQLGISRALQNWEPDLRPPLRSAGFLTRDSRIVERKKPGKAKARKSFQWVKR